MAISQQRTKSRRRIDPGQPPFPIIYDPVSAELTDAGNIRITWPQPIRITGLPLVGIPAGNTASGISLVSAAVAELVFPDPVEPGQSIVVRGQDPAWRGLNGEWLGSVKFPAGQGEFGTLPNQNWITSCVVPTLGDETVRVTLAHGQSGLAASIIQVRVNTESASSAVEISPTVYDITYPAPAMPGDELELGQWAVGGKSGEEWLAPTARLLTD